MKNIINENGNVVIYENIFSTLEANQLLITLTEPLSWQQEYIRIFGKNILCPRLITWYGDPGVNHIYSGNPHVSSGWPPSLVMLKNKIQNIAKANFNFLLCNYYRNGEDYMGWHADNEKELGREPIIASISLGAERSFEFRHKLTTTKIALKLSPGSLLLMTGDTQQYWQHRLPKDKQCADARINLTFRNII
jgi:alkylated DNA repair dioxygenase AlkB